MLQTFVAKDSSESKVRAVLVGHSCIFFGLLRSGEFAPPLVQGGKTVEALLRLSSVRFDVCNGVAAIILTLSRSKSDLLGKGYI